MTIKIDGQLEIDYKRGVLYFHFEEGGGTILRIGNLGQLPRDVQSIDLIGPFEHQNVIRFSKTFDDDYVYPDDQKEDR